MSGTDQEREKLRRKARRWVQAIYVVFIMVFVAALLVEVTVQALVRSPGQESAGQCASGIVSLMNALEHARSAACKTEVTEEQALTVFRGNLEPAWSKLSTIRRACEDSKANIETLDAVEYLRYAEENAVRRESSELADLRRQARELVERNVRNVPFTR
jgi:hypothetical protein